MNNYEHTTTLRFNGHWISVTGKGLILIDGELLQDTEHDVKCVSLHSGDVSLEQLKYIHAENKKYFDILIGDNE